MSRTVTSLLTIGLVIAACWVFCPRSTAAEAPALSTQPADTWAERSPLPDGPVSPRLGYDGACDWDSRQQLVVRYGGHNQGGGGEQGAEVWTSVSGKPTRRSSASGISKTTGRMPT